VIDLDDGVANHKNYPEQKIAERKNLFSFVVPPDAVFSKRGFASKRPAKDDLRAEPGYNK
jgi:hypothetical protein